MCVRPKIEILKFDEIFLQQRKIHLEISTKIFFNKDIKNRSHSLTKIQDLIYTIYTLRLL